MKKIIISTLAIAVLSIGIANAQTRISPPSDVYDSDAIILNIIDNQGSLQRIHDFVFYLSEVVGPRMMGTPGEWWGAQEMASRLRANGVEDVQIFPFPRNILDITEDNLTPDPFGRLLPSLFIHNYTSPRNAAYNVPETVERRGLSVYHGPTGSGTFYAPGVTATGAEGITGTIVRVGYGRLQDYTDRGLGTQRRRGAFVPQVPPNSIVVVDLPMINQCRKINEEARANLVVNNRCAACNLPRTVADRNALHLPMIQEAYHRALHAGAKVVLFNVPEPDVRLHSSINTTGWMPEDGDMLMDLRRDNPDDVRIAATGWPVRGGVGRPIFANHEISESGEFGVLEANLIPYAFVPDFHAEILHNGARVTYILDVYDTSWNVVATIPPSIPNPDAPIIIFIAHIDGVAATPGANDNAAGMALITEMARVYQQLHNAGLLNAEIVIIGAGAEEDGIHGSYAIAESDKPWRAHIPTGFDAERLSRIIAVYNFDCVASSDTWNSGMTIVLRQRYSENKHTAPIMDLVAINTIAAAQRLYNMPMIPFNEANPSQCPATNPRPVMPSPGSKFPTIEQMAAHGWGIKVSNGGDSDHEPFGIRHGIPNANHTFRIAHAHPKQVGVPGSRRWPGTVQLETRYHVVDDIFDRNYCKTRMEVVFRIAAAASFSITAGTHIPQGEIISTVTFDANGGEGTTARTIIWPSTSISNADGVNFPENPTRQGFTFLGWDATAVYGGELQKSPSWFDPSAPILTSRWFSDQSPFTHDITVVAKWSCNNAHTWGAWETISGVRTRKCTVCDEVETREN
ncbi:MAG: M28 family peptidase [Bacteroidales bacterium]|nr:M28 family peptidase [Bacteroidales bacterium]